jgi:hypothetical protein
MNIKPMLLVAGALAVFAGIIYFAFTPAQTPVTNTPAANSHTFVWNYTDVGTDASTGANRTAVTLIADGKTYDAGTYNGSCAEVQTGGGVDGTGLVAGEVTATQCWFAGGGDEIAVFSENGSLVIKHGELGEPQGDGTGAFRGNFSTLLSL